MHLRVGMHAFTQYLNGNDCYLHPGKAGSKTQIEQNRDYVLFVLKVLTRFVN